MSNLRILCRNVADTATISATTANASYPATNLQDASRGKVLRTTDASAAREIKLTWAANQTVDCIALCRHNLTDSATWTVTLYSDTAWTTSLESSGSIDAFDAADLGPNAAITDSDVRGLKNSVYYCTTQRTTVKSLKIQLDDTGNADGYLEAARLFVGAYQSPTRNPAYGLNVRWDEATQLVRMESGSLRATQSVLPWRQVRAVIPPADATDRTMWSDLVRYAGYRRDFWLDIYPADTTAKGLEGRGQFRFRSCNGLTHELPAHWATSWEMEEA